MTEKNQLSYLERMKALMEEEDKPEVPPLYTNEHKKNRKKNPYKISKANNSGNVRRGKETQQSNRPHRVGKKETTPKADGVAEINTVSPLFVGQVKALWDLNLPMREIAQRLQTKEQRIQLIAEHYDFPDRMRIPVVKLNEEELTLLTEEYEKGTLIKDISELLGWTETKVLKMAKRYGLVRNRTHPEHPVMPTYEDVEIPEIPINDVTDLDELELLSENEIQKLQHNTLKPSSGNSDVFNDTVRKWEDHYRMENLKDLREEEFTEQMKTVATMRNYAYQTLNVIGNSAGEIAAHDEDLLKTANTIKACVDMLDKASKNGTQTLKMDQAMESESAATLFNIDFMAAARAGGLKETKPQTKRLNVQHDDYEEQDY